MSPKPVRYPKLPPTPEAVQRRKLLPLWWMLVVIGLGVVFFIPIQAVQMVALVVVVVGSFNLRDIFFDRWRQ